MAASISMKELLEAGVHFGHQTRRWNPKMKTYIFGSRNGIHIIDLQKTVSLFATAYEFVVRTVAQGYPVLFVGTKKQAHDAITEESERCGMFYTVNRWLGGTLTNFQTIRKSIARLKELESMKADDQHEQLFLVALEHATFANRRHELARVIIGLERRARSRLGCATAPSAKAPRSPRRCSCRRPTPTATRSRSGRSGP